MNTVDDIMEQIHDKEDIPLDDLVIYYGVGKKLEKGRTLMDYGIQSGSTIFLHPAIRGGGGPFAQRSLSG